MSGVPDQPGRNLIPRFIVITSSSRNCQKHIRLRGCEQPNLTTLTVIFGVPSTPFWMVLLSIRLAIRVATTRPARRENPVHVGAILCLEAVWQPGFGQVDLTKWIWQTGFRGFDKRIQQAKVVIS